MAPLPIISGITRVAFNWAGSVAGHPTATNVMHFATSEDPMGLAEILNDAVEEAGDELFSPTSAIFSVVNTTMTPLDGTSASVVVPTQPHPGWSGGGGTDYTPQVCALVKFSSAQRGRSKRGRIYIPFVAENRQLNGDLDPDQVLASAAAWNDFLEHAGGNGALAMVASYKLETAVPITSFLCERSVATQRRRNKRSGL